MFVVDNIVIIAGVILIPLFSILAAKADKKLWATCQKHESSLRQQRQITLGKSHCR